MMHNESIHQRKSNDIQSKFNEATTFLMNMRVQLNEIGQSSKRGMADEKMIERTIQSLKSDVGGFKIKQDELNDIVNQQLENQTLWQSKMRNIKEEYRLLKRAVFQKSQAIEREKKEVQLLLGAENDQIHDDSLRRHREYMAQQNSLKNSIKMIESIKEKGADILSRMALQKETVARIQETVTSMGVTLGLSQSTLRAINARLTGDAIIVYTGIFLLSCCMIAIYWYI